MGKKKTITIVQGLVSDFLVQMLLKKKVKEVFLLEGRTSMPETRKSCQKLLQKKIRPVIIADNMAGILFYKDMVKDVWLSYHLAERNGALCDIGGLILAVLGKRHRVPVNLYKARCKTKFMGHQKDILMFEGRRTAPRGTKGYVPLVQWIDPKYITKVFKSENFKTGDRLS